MTELSAENTIQLEITPLPRAKLSTTEQELLPLIEGAIRNQGQGALLDNGELKIQIPQTFPAGTTVTVIVVTYLCKAAYDVVKKVVIPVLQKKYGVRQR